MKKSLLVLVLTILISCTLPEFGRAQGAPQSIKPLMTGLISMGVVTCLTQASNLCAPDNSLADANSMPGILRGVVINVTWAQLQPTPGAFNPQAIDQALETFAQYNGKYPATPLHATLRVWTGALAPDWAKKLGGGPVSILHRNTKSELAVPLFWTADYKKAWRSLQAQLAAKYDRNPLIAQISDTTCSHQTAESYVNPVDSASIVAMFKAGFTNQAYINCISDSIHDYDAWRITRIDFTQNPFENLSINTANGIEQGQYGPLDPNVTVKIMSAFRSALGERAIISNHNIVFPPVKANAGLYQAMQALGGPMQFQTASPGVDFANGRSTGLLKDWDGMVRYGVSLGATGIEIWPSFAFKGNPVNDGWNPIKCNADVPPSECSGRTRADLLKWNKELETGSTLSR